MNRKQKAIAGLTFVALGATALSPVAVSALMQDQNAGGPPRENADRGPEQNRVSPARRINRDNRPDRPARQTLEPGEVRTIDGSDNNIFDFEIGSTFVHLLRIAPAAYADGASAIAGAERPSARAVSNGVVAQDASIPNPAGLTDYFWQWGQFLDHDLDLTDGIDPPEAADIAVPIGDIFFDPNATGTQVISFNRSLYDSATGTAFNNPRQQENEITAWIDASNVYGSDAVRAAALRTLDGTGKLKTSAGDLLPFNTEGLANAGGDSAALFLAGDVRANEQVGLTAMHTLFVREHNRLVDEIVAEEPGLSGDEIYERARAIVGAQMQVITYEEFLPALLGRRALPRYRGYNPELDASIANSFSTAAYRFGHSALSEQILRLDADGNEIAAGHLELREAFFNPSRITDEGGIDPVLRGLAAQVCQKVDPFVIDAVRNFLFGPPGAGGFDLASLNIQRGRDHGLPSYNDMRDAVGLSRVTSVAEISSDTEVQQRLLDTYGGVDDIDLWVGGLAEDAVNGGQLGELFSVIVTRQFTALRDGDRFWYERVFGGRELQRIRETTLSDIIRRNTGIGRELQRDVFHLSSAGGSTSGRSDGNRRR